MLNIVFVCTGNICRSPLAQLLLAERLSDTPATIFSSGTLARDGMSMTPEMAQIADEHGIPLGRVRHHRAQHLRSVSLEDVDLAIGMAREHRRELVELRPSLARRTFTLREFARLAARLDEADLNHEAQMCSASDAQDRLSGMLALVSSQRGREHPPAEAGDDDVVDPFRRSRRTYELSAGQIASAVPEIERLVRVAYQT